MDSLPEVRISVSNGNSLLHNVADSSTASPSYELTPRQNYVPRPIFVSSNQTFTDEGGNTFLHNAARAANLAQVRNLLPLASHASLHVSNSTGFKPLHYIVKHSGKAWHDVLIAILKKGGFTMHSNRDGDTPLHIAAQEQNLRAVEALVIHESEMAASAGRLPSQASPQVSNSAGFKPLHYIVQHRGKAWHDVLIMVLKKGGFTMDGNCDGDTPLHIAAGKQNARAVEALVNHELEVGASTGRLPSNQRNQTSLDVAVRASTDPKMSDMILTLVEGSHLLNKLLEAVLDTLRTCDENSNEPDKECPPQAILLWFLSLQRNSQVCSKEYLKALWRLEEQDQLKICQEWLKGSDWLYYTLLWLVPRPDFDVQYVYAGRQTILHVVLTADCEEIVKLIFKRQDLVEADFEDEKGITPVQIAVEKGLREIEILLMRRPEVKESVERQYRDRQVYVDAANAILVGSALIASVTFAGWLQPPLGYGNGKDNVKMYVAVQGHPGVSSFWVFNCLSFLFAMATVVAAAGAVLPRPDLYVGVAVHRLKRSLSMAASLLLLATMFGVAAFCSAGFAVLPPILKWDLAMILPVLLGGSVNVFMMGWFLKGLLHLGPGYGRRMKKIRSKAKARRILHQY